MRHRTLLVPATLALAVTLALAAFGPPLHAAGPPLHATGPPPSADLAPEPKVCVVPVEICRPPVDIGAGVTMTRCTTTPTPCENIHMAYATRDDLVARFGADELDEIAPLDDHGASRRAEAVIADACAEIDAVLAEGYDLPLPSGEYPLLKAAACDVARLRLYDDTAPDRVMGGASSAHKRIRQLAAGELHLLAATGARVERRSGILIDAGEPVATRDQLSGYMGDASISTLTLRTDRG